MSKIYKSLVKSFNDELQHYDNDEHIPCVVFDIDGTILNDGVYSPSDSNDIINSVYDFLQYTQRMGINIFIITARPENNLNRLGTEKMLKKLNINYTFLYMWDHDIFDNNTIFKEEARKEIFNNGFNIIMSLGDNEWDYGDYGGLGVHIFNNGESIRYIYDFL